MIKKALFGILFIFLFALSINSSQAADWVQVKANNGKSAMLSTDNIEIMDGRYVKYWVKSTIGSYTYKYFMVSDYTEKTSCIVETYKYNKAGTLVDSSKNDLKLDKIMPDTLNEALYEKVCGLIKNSPLSVNSSLWANYFGAVQDEVEKLWKPKNDKTSQDNLSASCLFELNSKGEIIRKEIVKPSNNAKFNKSIEETLDALTQFYTLPSDYSGNVQFILEFNYTLNGDKQAQVAAMGANGVGTVTISKRKAQVGKAILDGVGTILVLPFAILGILMGA